VSQHEHLADLDRYVTDARDALRDMRVATEGVEEAIHRVQAALESFRARHEEEDTHA
jgi:predicted  nucleic acid-binding Zn-ribbon protein